MSKTPAKKILPDCADTTPCSQDCRTLVVVPVIHTLEDLGSIGQKVMSTDSGSDAVKSEKIAAIWERIADRIEHRHMDFKTIRLYQDGLPVCGQEMRIACDMAKKGSLNHRLLLRLVERGATIVGTESAALLMEEYKLIVNSMDGGKPVAEPVAAPDEKFRTLLEKRDRAIASRIDDTLKRGETGILFIGMLHNVEKWLVDDIRVEHLFVNETDYPISVDV